MTRWHVWGIAAGGWTLSAIVGTWAEVKALQSIHRKRYGVLNVRPIE